LKHFQFFNAYFFSLVNLLTWSLGINRSEERRDLKEFFLIFSFMSCRIGGQGTAQGQPPPFRSVPASRQRPSTRPRPIRKLPWDSDGRASKIELPVFVPGPWVVDGASPERRFSHAASTAPERLRPVTAIRISVVMSCLV